MVKGRKPQYQLNENIVQVEIRSGYRYGRCVKCDKAVKARNWHKHAHDQEVEIPSMNLDNLNRACLDQIKTICNQAIDTEGSYFLQRNFPGGITGLAKERYIASIHERLTTLLLIDPRSPEDIPSESIQAEEPLEQEKDQDQLVEDIPQQLEESSSQKQIEEQGIKFEAPKTQFPRNRVRQYFSKAQRQAKQDFLDSLFTQVNYEVSLQGVKLKSLMNSYRLKKEKADTLAKAFSPKNTKDHSLLFLLKQCFVCTTSICKISGSLRQCILCRTKIHMQCLKQLDGCFCGKTPPLSWHANRQILLEPQEIQQEKILSFHYQGIKAFNPVASKKKIDQAQKVIKNQIKARQLKYTSVAHVCSLDQKIEINALNDPFLTRAQDKLVEIYERYQQEIYKAPVQLLEIGKSSFGIQAIQDIPAYSFVCEYACDIIPMVYVQHINYSNQVMFYANGKTSKQQLVLVPRTCSNWGPLLNHDEVGNCASLRIVIKGKIRVILYSKKIIRKGQQLLYNYNADLNEYPTENFRDLKK